MASDNLVLRSGNWHARLAIPEDARPALNRREFTASLKTGSKTEAQRLKIPYLQEWQSLIDQARIKTKIDPEDARIEAKRMAERAQAFFADMAQATVMERPIASLNADFAADFLKLDQNHTQEKWERILRHFEIGEKVDVLALNQDFQNLIQENMERQSNTLPLKPEEKEDIRKILKDPTHYRAKSPITTARIKTFKSYQENVKGIVQKTVDTQVARLENLKKWLENNRRDLTHESITAYMDTLSVSEKTKKQFLFAGSSFWKWARIEELCRLKTSDIINDEGIKCFSIKDAKTAAGERNIPIHSALLHVIDRLVENSEDGYLIKSTSGNKYGNRSDALSKQFGRLKTDLGYNSQFVFHSLRKTVITQLQRADIPGILIAAIVGHETGTITFDVYSSGPSPSQKHKAISKLKYPLSH